MEVLSDESQNTYRIFVVLLRSLTGSSLWEKDSKRRSIGKAVKRNVAFNLISTGNIRLKNNCNDFAPRDNVLRKLFLYYTELTDLS